MASDDSDNYNYSDDEIEDNQHQKIVEDVLNLNKVQNLKKPSRTEPTLHISEFDLVKSVTGNKGSVHINELTKVLKNRKKHLEIGTKINKTTNKALTLPKPLEKPQAERIRRAVAYEKNRLEFDKWEAFITSNRAASHVSFPLTVTDSLKIEKEHSKVPCNWRIKSDLQTKLEKLEEVKEYHVETEKESFPLSMEEIMEKRKEAAKLRAHQSYKEAKARRQNKIKSKKYHRIQKREKIKQHLKEFEQLQKTNPEEALKKLEDIEKARAEERFSLRHKGTGQWAKNKQIRAKYDKESRQVLAQQLAISRDLTQKLKAVTSESEDEGIESEETVLNIGKGGDNPWVNGIKPASEVADFVSGYRKYWNEQGKKSDKVDVAEIEVVISNHEDNTAKQINKFKEELKKNIEKVSVEKNIRSKSAKNKVEKSKQESKNKKINTSLSTSDWEVSTVQIENEDNQESLEDIFDRLEDKLSSKMKAKLHKIQMKNGIKKKNKKTAKSKADKKKKIDLTMKSQSKKPVIDEPLNENAGSEENISTEVNALKNILESVVNEEDAPSDIDPNKFIKVKTTNLNTAIPDILTVDENEENGSQRDIIMEAFEDDDIVEDFTKEKAEEIDKDKPKDIDLTLPGWGDWGGTGILPSKRKKKWFLLKMPEVIPRKDDNKGSLIINENAQTKMKEHMVADIPFPFKTVKDFQASIRAPIGNTFVPETAFRRFIEPAVTTKMGAIIEPVTKDILMGRRKH